MTALSNKFANARFLIVDDNHANGILLCKMLNKAGYQNIVVITDPCKVPELYQTESFDLILLDILMPKMDGIEVMQTLNEIKGDDYLPILVLTVELDHNIRNQALVAGAKDFLTKPFDYTEVLNRIHNMLEVRFMHNQLRDQKQHLEHEVKRRTKALEETRLGIIQRLGRVAEYRDNETGMHVIRMSKYCELMAQESGMSEAECWGLFNAAPMHDVGKIAIPDKILLKEGPLDKEEWEVMKTHAKLGAELLDGYDFGVLALARNLALTHHEKWNGSGYPQGLKGEEIPLDTRILMICDVFDALTSKRPYKEAWSVEQAMAEIEEGSGIHFDPDLVVQFKKILPEILSIREEFHD
jgi:cyclic di-GMP phosphodiesterase